MFDYHVLLKKTLKLILFETRPLLTFMWGGGRLSLIFSYKNNVRTFRKM